MDLRKRLDTTEALRDKQSISAIILSTKAAAPINSNTKKKLRISSQHPLLHVNKYYY